VTTLLIALAALTAVTGILTALIVWLAVERAHRRREARYRFFEERENAVSERAEGKRLVRGSGA